MKRSVSHHWADRRPASARPGILGVLIIVITLSLSLVVATGCPEEAGREGDVVTILMEGLKFTPSEVTIEPGVTVRWVNQDQTAHTSTAEGWQEGVEQPLLWNSMPLNPDESFELRFDTVGVYDYFCMVHPYMTGRIIVREEGGPEPTDVFVPTSTTAAGEGPGEDHGMDADEGMDPMQEMGSEDHPETTTSTTGS